MLYYRKLKPDWSPVGLLPALVALAILFFSIIFLGLAIAYKVLAAILLFYTAFQYYAFTKVRSLGYFISATYMLSFGLFLVFLPVSIGKFSNGEFSNISKFLLFTTVTLLLFLVYLLITRKTKWRGREVFELAAAPVETMTNGFTERPRPVGKKEYVKSDLLAFSRFLSTNHIALPFVEEDRIVMIPLIMGKEFQLLYSLNPNYIEKSWVAFNYNGDITVHISKSDYLEFKDQLSFDQLCESMGELFKEFFDLFLKNEGVRVIDRLNSLGVSVFT